MKNLGILLAILLAVTSCKEEVPPLTFNSEEILIKSDAEINVLLTKALSGSEVADKINSAINNEIVKSISGASSSRSLDKALLNFDKEFVDYKNNFPEDEQDWTLDIESELTYQSPEIVTIAISIYIDKGGAHGNDSIRFLNFDPLTGNLLRHSDIISDIEKFKTLAKSYFKTSNTLEDSAIDDMFIDKTFKLPENIGFTEDGLVLLYNIYEIESYNPGYTEFVIPFKAAQPYLKIY
ncbi:MAG: DUF4163 domain-containing protein [Winogradskyella sp.]|uniref:DUF3298 and DUF4163 domain-containing protein n=1 Tax=Winogradskyella sp. TaxID=1883156 RepID=UPI001817AA88|nr:DUF4163 domain-containing protein [Winogradskyella sp.]